MGYKKLRISRTPKYDTFYSLDYMYYLCVVEQNKYVLVICMWPTWDWIEMDDISWYFSTHAAMAACVH